MYSELIWYWCFRRGRPLWSCEDITPRTLKTQSAYKLEYFLKCVVKCFKELSPIALVEQRWSHVALQLALSCSSRHYAGRSFQVTCSFISLMYIFRVCYVRYAKTQNVDWLFQVLRALHIRPTTQMLSDILSRLVETVAEQGEDMQVSGVELKHAWCPDKWKTVHWFNLYGSVCVQVKF